MARAADTCGAACDVPARYAYSFVPPWTQYVERMAPSGERVGSSPPGAAMPQVAPPTPLAYEGLASSRSVAVTTTAGSLENPEPVTKPLPAATTGMAPAFHASWSTLPKLGPNTAWVSSPSDRLMTLAPCATAH